jgi:hypothetical protein
MTRSRIFATLVLIVIPAMMSDASAQGCPEWLNWFCFGGASPNAVGSQGSWQDRRRTKPASRSAINRKAKNVRSPAAATAKSQTKALETARPVRSDATISDSEKELLFQQFLEWDTARRLKGETSQ